MGEIIEEKSDIDSDVQKYNLEVLKGILAFGKKNKNVIDLTQEFIGFKETNSELASQFEDSIKELRKAA